MNRREINFLSGSVHKNTMLLQSSLCDVTHHHCGQTSCSCRLNNPKEKLVLPVKKQHRAFHPYLIFTSILWVRPQHCGCDTRDSGMLFFLQRLEVVNHTHTVNSAVTESVKQVGGKFSSPKKNPTVLTKVTAFDLSVTPLLH